jgi:hypothetical protein
MTVMNSDPTTYELLIEDEIESARWDAVHGLAALVIWADDTEPF